MLLFLSVLNRALQDYLKEDGGLKQPHARDYGWTDVYNADYVRAYYPYFLLPDHQAAEEER